MKTYPHFYHNLFTSAGGGLIGNGNNSSKRLPLNFRKFQSQRGRDAILMSMRHWLAGVLAREQPALFRDLPESFKVGQPLPQKQTGSAAALPYHKPKAVGLTAGQPRYWGRAVASLRRTGGNVSSCEFVPFVSKFCAGRQGIISRWKPQLSSARRRPVRPATARRFACIYSPVPTGPPGDVSSRLVAPPRTGRFARR